MLHLLQMQMQAKTLLVQPPLFSLPSNHGNKHTIRTRHHHKPASPGSAHLSSFVTKARRALRLLATTDEFAVENDGFLEGFRARDKISEEESRRRNWVERGWAPWEEIMTPEGVFARESLNEGEEVPLQTQEAIEAFKMLSPKYRRKKMEEQGMSEDEYLRKQFEIKGAIPEPIKTTWNGPMVLALVPPRDWPPPGWEVDADELAFIREVHKMQAVRVDPKELENPRDATDASFARYQVFVKQYKEWAAANRERLEKESYEVDQDYHPGRRKRGKDYNENMLELPFFYPGQICQGVVTTLHLYQGAFVDIGCVHDGWVPIKGNDWFWIRHHIKIGMHVYVEILAKRDPYRYRFPIEMRLVHPNIDHLIFNRFDSPPIFHRDGDDNPDELSHETGRYLVPRRRPKSKPEDRPLLSDHPYVDKVWQLHVSEQMILDDEEKNPDKYKKGSSTPSPDSESVASDEDSVEYSEGYIGKALVPKMILRTNIKELDLDAARAERQLNNKLKKEAEARGEEFRVSKLRRHHEMDELDLIHWRRSLEEREALIRDISCRRSLGLPVEEPGRYADDNFFGKDSYDPTSPLYRYDYWGEPKNSEKSRKERETDTHNKSIVGRGTVWYEMSYEDTIRQRMQREARAKRMQPKEAEAGLKDEDSDSNSNSDTFIRMSGGDKKSSSSKTPLVNGTESSSLSDEGMFGN